MSKWMKTLVKDFGKVAADIPSPTANVIKMPSPSLNWAVGNGGISAGKIALLFGPESSGKSLLAQLILVEVQKKDPEAICVLFDAEFSFNPDWFSKLGGDLDRLVVRQTNDPVKIFDWIEGDLQESLEEGAPVRAVMIDSVKSIRYPKDHKKTSTDSTMMGSGAPYLSVAFKMIIPVIRKYSLTCLLVQQVYEESDQYKKMVTPWVVPDGRALRHACDYMLQVDRIDNKDGRITAGKNIAGNAQQVGHRVRVKAQKNRVGAPYRTAEFSLLYSVGIVDKEEEIYELAKSLGVIDHPINPQTGKVNPQMWQFKNYTPVRGEDNMKSWVVGQPHVIEELYEACMMENSEAAVERRTQLLAAASDDTGFDIDLDNL